MAAAQTQISGGCDMFYSVEVINEALLQAVLGGQITQDEAKTLLAKMRAKRKKGLIGIAVCVGAFVLSCVAFMLIVNFVKRPPDALMIGLLATLFIGVFGGIFTLNALFIARQYIKALKLGYPQVF
jgi:hypothetical protein